MRDRSKLVAAAVLLLAAGCGEDGPRLYIVRGPDAVREPDNKVRVEGQLWSVVEWPAGNEFCVDAVWTAPAPGGVLDMAEVCSSDPVPAPNPPQGEQGEWPFVLRSSGAIALDPGITIDVTVTSEFFQNQGHPHTDTIASP